MKKGLKILLSVVAFIYFSIIIVITGFLLCYNQYKITVINDNTFLLIDDKSEKYKDGDLVIVKRNPNNEINVNDEILFYDMDKGKVTVNSGVVTKTRVVNDVEMTFTINNSHDISSQTVVGKTSSAKVYPGLGKILYIIESRFGFLLLVIFPALMFFFYEAYHLIHEIRNPDDDEDDDEDNSDLERKEVLEEKPESESSIMNVTSALDEKKEFENSAVESKNVLEEKTEPENSVTAEPENTLEDNSSDIVKDDSTVNASEINKELGDIFNSSLISSVAQDSQENSSDDVESLF